MPRTRIADEHVEAGLDHLRGDPVMHAVIEAVGPFTLRLQTDRFRSLVRAILAQQISTAAARTITKRVEEAVGDPFTPECVGRIADADLRAAGVSSQKRGYLRSLCEHATDGSLDLRNLGRKSDSAVVAALTQVKGIGVWTAQMFLIFTLGRLDVLPVDDLGIRSNMRRLYDLPDLPNRRTCEEVAAPWRPYASIASWYLWRSDELD